MKKFALLLLASGMILGACKKDEDDDNGSSGYITDGLVIEEKQNVLIMENTGAWCQFCPYGAEIMHALGVAYDYALPVAIHNNDGLATATAVKMEGEFVAAGGYPTIHVMSTPLDNYNDANGYVNLGASLEPTIGVAHAVTDKDTAFVVDVKVKVFRDLTGTPDLFVQSYLLLDGVLAKIYTGGDDLRQVSSVPFVDMGTTQSVWTENAAEVNGVPTITAGTLYRHEHNLWSEATADSALTDWGRPLAEINPFGSEYVEGDIYGTKYTPIRFYLKKPVGAVLEFEGYSVLTVIWRTQTDGEPGEVEFVNGYMSHISLD